MLLADGGHYCETMDINCDEGSSCKDCPFWTEWEESQLQEKARLYKQPLKNGE